MTRFLAGEKEKQIPEGNDRKKGKGEKFESEKGGARRARA
jgi:hypothetical protein